MEKNKFSIQGRIIDKQNGGKLSKARVEAWDKDLLIDDLLGSAVTDKEGKFTINFDETYYEELCFDRKPDVYFKVFYKNKLLCSTEENVLWNVSSSEVADVQIPVTLTTKGSHTGSCPPAGNRDDTNYVVSGKITSDKGKPLVNLIVRAFDCNLDSENILGRPCTTDKRGQYKITYTENQFRKSNQEKDGADLIVRVYNPAGDKTKSIAQSGTRNNAGQNEIIDITVENAEKLERLSILLKGAIHSPVLPDYAALTVKIYDKTLDAPPKKVAQIQPGEKGYYETTIKDEANVFKGSYNLQAQLFFGEKKVGESRILYNVTNDATLNIAVDEKSLPSMTSEYDLLRSHLALNYCGDLNQLVEDGRLDQITQLSKSSGWDARLVAMAAKAEELSASTGIEPEQYYALFRAGVSGDLKSLSRLTSDQIKEAIDLAAENNVIAGDFDTTVTTRAIREASATTLLKDTSMGVSDLESMLNLSLDKQQTNLFLESYQNNSGDAEAFWSSLENAGFSPENISKLQLDGKLGYLTGQNAPLVQRIYDQYNITDPADLVRQGLYNDKNWQGIIGKDSPSGINRKEYSQYLADRLRKSYPTLVMAEMINRKEVKLPARAPKEELYNFFNNNHSSYVFGKTPLSSWEGFEDLSEEARKSAKAMERTYRLSPDLEAMNTLTTLELTSAHEITRHTKKDFLNKYSDKFPSEEIASQVFNAALQVKSTMVNFFWAYSSFGNQSQQLPLQSLNLYNYSGKGGKTGSMGIEIDGAKLPELSNRMLAIEANFSKLMGNMDYCSCDHCRSVLSPAAYLVEILNFIDNDNPAADFPLKTLRKRRPDLEHIQLTCENTNTILPYIDIVNEILEYYILNNDLNGFTGYNVEEGTLSADLLASPEFVKDNAYANIKTSVYPPLLPFDYLLEKLRLIFQIWEVSLADIFSALKQPAQARKEILALNSAEYHILTNITYKQLPEFFGENGTLTISDLHDQVANGKTFCQKMQLTYEELFELLKTDFINPHSNLIALLNNLQISSDDLNNFYSGTLAGPLEDLLPAGLDVSDYDGNVASWLNTNKSKIESIIVLSETDSSASACDFSNLQLSKILPGTTDYKLTEIDFHKLNRFIRLWKKTGWKMSLVDKIISFFSPVLPDLLSVNPPDAGFIDNVFATLLARLANFMTIINKRSLSEKKMLIWLDLWNPDKTSDIKMALLAELVKKDPSQVAKLAAFADIDPLASDMETDQPSLNRFLEIIDLLKTAKIAINDLDYILRHNDEEGKLAPRKDELEKDIIALRNAINAVDTELSMAPDNPDFDFAREKMALVYDNGVVETFFEFLSETTFYASPFNTTTTALPQAVSDLESRLVFDPFKKELTLTGQLEETGKNALIVAVNALTKPDVPGIDTPSQLTNYKTTLTNAINDLYSQSVTRFDDFFTNYADLLPTYTSAAAQSEPEVQTTIILEDILENLRFTLKENALKATLGSSLKCEPEIISAFTSHQDVIYSLQDNIKPILHDFLSLQTVPDFSLDGAYEFYINPPANDDYLIFIKAPAGTQIALQIDGSTVIDETMGSTGETNTALTAIAGELIFAQLNITGLGTGKKVELLWQTKGMAKTAIPEKQLYQKASLQVALQSLVRLQKASHLNTLLKLSPQEIVFFASLSTETGGFLNKIAFDENILPADLTTLWEQTEKLIHFNLLKKENEPEENTWLQILKDPHIEKPEGQSLILGTTGWNEADLNEALTRFSITQDDLNSLGNVKKVKELLNIVAKTELPAANILSWVTATPDANLLKQIEDTIKEKTDRNVWLDTLQSVNDKLRNMRRDAMVAYILHHMPPEPEIDTPNKLYEYFLIDVEMNSCMKTSRIKQAILTVQLFIQRCLMNLETEVDAALIDVAQWEWMKRYRIWEANRKIFLYPENWLEPEFRSDKSFLFTELEGKLLQADINKELAREAFLGYLKQLDDISRLEMVASCLEEDKEGDQTRDTLHVLARTNGNSRQYYYRKNDRYGFWTPWEKITANIEGEHVMPVIWKGQLFLFWLNIMEKQAEPDNKNLHELAGDKWGDSKKTNVEINICWAEYYNGKWVSPKSSDMNEPIVLKKLVDFNRRNIKTFTSKVNKTEAEPETLIFHLYHELPNGSGPHWHYMANFVSKNIPPQYIKDEDDAIHDDFFLGLEDYFDGKFINEKIIKGGKDVNVIIDKPGGSEFSLNLLSKGTYGSSITPSRHASGNFKTAPFFYEDKRAVFYVKPEETTHTIPIYNGYWDILELEPIEIFIPHLIPEPIPIIEEMPPDEMFSPGSGYADPVPDNYGAVDFGAMMGTTGMINVLSSNQTFQMGEVAISSDGKVGDIRNFSNLKFRQ